MLFHHCTMFESIEQIVQYPDGGGELVFSKSFRHSSSPRVSVYEPSRASSSSIPVRTTREEEGSSSGNPKNIKLTGVRSYTNVARPFYSEENESTQESQQDESLLLSLSDEDFEINKDLLRKDFYSEVNKQRNDWFFSTIPKRVNNTKSTDKIKSFEFSKEFQENPQINQAFVDRINQKIKDNLVAPLTIQPHKRINMVKGDISSEEEADELIKMFEEPHNQIISKDINNLEAFKTRNYYPRPTFPDMQFEERNQYTQASYTSGTIYEWNIDGMTEYNILTKLQEMTMVSTTYKLNNRPDHVSSSDHCSLGFLGRLKGWWDNYLTFDDRNSILKAYRINENSEVVKDEDGQDIEDVVATLIYSISKHFIGDPDQDKGTDNGQIPYDKLTYGEIISIVTLVSPKETMPPSKQKPSRKPSKDEFYHNSESRTDSDNEDDINQLDSSGEVSSQSSSDQAECIKGNCNCRPKTINVISQDQEFILDTLRKVEDEKTKQNLYEVFKKSVVKVEAKKTVNPYNLNDILNRFDQQSPKEVSIKELHEEVKI
ncbi:hypothetical protein AAG906_004500 [Vitis piasezkii]